MALNNKVECVTFIILILYIKENERRLEVVVYTLLWIYLFQLHEVLFFEQYQKALKEISSSWEINLCFGNLYA